MISETSTARPSADRPSSAPSPAMALLQAHVPLTLLLDLAHGVRSSEVYAAEVPDLTWLQPSAVA